MSRTEAQHLRRAGAHHDSAQTALTGWGALAGFVGGLLGYVVVQILTRSDNGNFLGPAFGLGFHLANTLKFILLAAVTGFAVMVTPGLFRHGGTRVASRGGRAAAVSAAGGLVGGLVLWVMIETSFVFDRLKDLGGFSFALMWFDRLEFGVAYALIGAAIGLAVGWWGWPRTPLAAIGGLVGGLIGGIVSTWFLTETYDSLNLTLIHAVHVVLPMLIIGAGIGLVRQLHRSAAN